MSMISRRSVLQAAGAAGLVLALPGWESTARAATGSSIESLRERWVDSLTGRHLIPASPATFAPAIAALDSGVDTRIKAIDPGPTRYFRNRDWTTLPTAYSNTNNMRLNYTDLAQLATAWATPTSRHYHSSAVRDAVLAGLEHMHRVIYNDSTTWWGNWWSWNIGAAKPLADIMAILHGELTADQIARYCAAIDHFLPRRDPRLQLHPTGGEQESDGANRVDICQSVIVRCLVHPDEELLRRAVAALSPTWQYVTEGNGFFRDGSFIQHSTLGYTGTYGTVLLGGLAKLFSLLAGSPFDITDPTKSNVYTAIDASYAPVVFNGQMMDSVRGRAISRPAERSIDNGNDLIEYMLRLATAVDARTAARWRGLCKQWVQTNGAATIQKSSNIVRLALVEELMKSSVAPVPDRSGALMFPAMDRLVYRAPGNTWALCVAMCSNRIAWHEGMESENWAGVKTSQGMSYLYLAEDDDHFDDEFWATSDLEAPPGTTVDLTPLPPNPEGDWGTRCPQNEWTGGVALDDLGMAGMHLVAPGGTGLRARKMWLTTPQGVVHLGADISTQSQGEVRTIVEHRNLGTSARKLVVDGRPVGSDPQQGAPRWAHLEGVGGYVFLDTGHTLSAEVGERSGSWRRNNSSTAPGTDTVHRRCYGTIAYRHGTGAAARGGYSYVVLPTATEQDTRRWAGDISGRMRVLCNDATAQAVQWGGDVVAAALWRPTSVGDLITVDAPACLLVRRSGAGFEVALSEPTQQRDAVTITVRRAALHRVSGPDVERLRFSRHGNRIQVRIDTSGLGGRAVRFRVTR